MIKRIAPALGQERTSVLVRDIRVALGQGYLRHSTLELKSLGIDARRAVDVSLAIICACTGQPLVVSTHLSRLDIKNHVRIDIYYFDPLVFTAPTASSSILSTKASSAAKQRSEDAIFKNLASAYRGFARRGSAVDTIPKATPGRCRALDGTIDLPWRRMVLPVLAEGKFKLLIPMFAELVADQRNEAIVALILDSYADTPS